VKLEEGIKLTSIDPKDIKIESLDVNGHKKQQFDFMGLKAVIMKVYFREKYLKKRGLLELSAEIEEGLAEEEITY